jgi:hypothetical protein
LLDAGQNDAVIEVAEHGLDRVAKAMGEADDSSGYFSDLIARLKTSITAPASPPSPIPWTRPSHVRGRQELARWVLGSWPVR